MVERQVNMAPELNVLIKKFRHAQDQGVELLVTKLGIPIPESNRGWFVYCRDSGLYSESQVDGVLVHAHGFGIAIETDKLCIDFDWGDNGEADGFDGWRLYVFSLEHGIDFGCTHKQCNDWIKQAYEAGELERDTHLYYDPRFRARR